MPARANHVSLATEPLSRYSGYLGAAAMHIYLDYNSTTPVDRAVLDAMLPFFAEKFGNASSIHSSGQRGRSAVDAARDSVADLIGAKPAEIVFTSGGTEADNLALFGSVAASSHSRKHIITTAIEHHAVLNAAQALEKQGIDVTYVSVGSAGIVDPQDIRHALRPDTILISVMHANNELGTIQPIEEIGRIAAEAQVYFHCDAVQSAGKLPLDVNRLGVHFLSISAHKIYGPKGVGALYVRAGTPLEPQFHGGHHERDRRPGTENVPGIAAFGAACEFAGRTLAAESERLASLRDRLETGVRQRIPGTGINGASALRTPNTSNIYFDSVDGEAMVIALDLRGFAVSTGSACSSGAITPSHVLTALGLSADRARSSLRFSLGRSNDAGQVDALVDALAAAVTHLRRISVHA